MTNKGLSDSNLLKLSNFETIQGRSCPRCNLYKPIDYFYRATAGRYGHRSICKACDDSAVKEIRTTSERAKKLHYLANKKWRSSHPEKRREMGIKGNAKRHSTVQGRLSHNISIRIGHDLHGNKNGEHWEKIVGYSIKQLKEHLERKFTTGMSWDNYGLHGWHVDHIIPQSAFNYETVDDIDFKKCWALKNLQPMWGAQNISKGNKVKKPFQPSLLMKEIPRETNACL
jgi:hypothetical protein